LTLAIGTFRQEDPWFIQASPQEFAGGHIEPWIALVTMQSFELIPFLII
jgi:hypothetical protein